VTEEQAVKARRMANSGNWTLEQIAVGCKVPTADMRKWLRLHGLTVFSAHYRPPSGREGVEPNR